MKINDVAQRINDEIFNSKLESFQDYRKKVNNMDNKPTSKMFIIDKRNENRNYTYHCGGRSEMQFNIGYDEFPGQPMFRYGMAFSLQKAQDLENPLEVLAPKIEHYNEYMTANYGNFSDLELIDSNGFISKSDKLIIDNSMIWQDNFIFLGIFIKKQFHQLTNSNFEDIVALFERLYPLYIYIEDNSNNKKKPSAKKPSTKPIVYSPGIRKGKWRIKYQSRIRSGTIDPKHSRMVEHSGSQLEAKWGSCNVGSDQITTQGTEIDLWVNEKGHMVYYEFKNTSSGKLAIREAIGQIMEYSYYPNNNRAEKLVIVSQHQIDKDSKLYLTKIRKEFKIPVYYQWFDENKNRLDGKRY